MIWHYYLVRYLYEKIFGKEKLIKKNNDMRIMFEYPSPKPNRKI
jgi:hypothetical protein